MIILDFINVTVRIDANEKKQSEQVREKRIPFELNLVEFDPFFNESNLARLNMSKKQIADGNIIYKTAEELGLDDE